MSTNSVLYRERSILGCGGTVDFTYNVLVKGFAGSMTAELADTVKQMPAVSNVQES